MERSVGVMRGQRSHDEEELQLLSTVYCQCRTAVPHARDRHLRAPAPARGPWSLHSSSSPHRHARTAAGVETCPSRQLYYPILEQHIALITRSSRQRPRQISACLDVITAPAPAAAPILFPLLRRASCAQVLSRLRDRCAGISSTSPWSDVPQSSLNIGH